MIYLDHQNAFLGLWFHIQIYILLEQCASQFWTMNKIGNLTSV